MSFSRQHNGSERKGNGDSVKNGIFIFDSSGHANRHEFIDRIVSDILKIHGMLLLGMREKYLLRFFLEELNSPPWKNAENY